MRLPPFQVQPQLEGPSDAQTLAMTPGQLQGERQLNDSLSQQFLLLGDLVQLDRVIN